MSYCWRDLLPERRAGAKLGDQHGGSKLDLVLLVVGSQVGSHRRSTWGHIEPATPFDSGCSPGIQRRPATSADTRDLVRIEVTYRCGLPGTYAQSGADAMRLCLGAGRGRRPGCPSLSSVPATPRRRPAPTRPSRTAASIGSSSGSAGISDRSPPDVRPPAEAMISRSRHCPGFALTTIPRAQCGAHCGQVPGEAPRCRLHAGRGCLTWAGDRPSSGNSYRRAGR